MLFVRLRRLVALLPEEAHAGTVSHERVGERPGGLIDLSGSTWQIDRIVEGKIERRKARKLLQRVERVRRRRQVDEPRLGRRLDPHGRHRVLAIVSLEFQLGDWRHEPLYSTVRL